MVKWLENEFYSEESNLNGEFKHYFFDGDKLDVDREDRITFGGGILTFPNGKKYIGEWKPSFGGAKNGVSYKEGLEHGRLTFSAYGGLRYQGRSKDGKCQEAFTTSDGLKFESKI